MPELDADLMQSLLSTFRVEAIEHIETLNQSLLAMERTPEGAERQTHIQTAFRAAHSLKGAARAVSIHDIERIAHAMETVLQQARDGSLTMSPDNCDLLYDSLDSIQTVLEEGSTDTNDIVNRLRAVTNQPAAEESTPAAAPAEMASTAGPIVQTDTIRVSVGKLDDLMAQIGELLVARISTDQRLGEIAAMRNQLGQWSKTWREISMILPRLSDDSGEKLVDILHRHADEMQAVNEAFTHLDQSAKRDASQLNMVADNLQEQVRRVRMIPFSTISLALERVVRDAARSENKEINFTIEGQSTEIDKKVIEALKDPLIHLLRNAVGHGIENVAVREEVGKPACGNVRLKLNQRGSEVHISVIDDGAGFDLEKLQAAYQAAYEGSDNGLDQSMSVAFLPGISTVSSVTELAGRGIGLDVVRSQIEALQGRINVESTPGEGATIELMVPTSMAMTRGLLVKAMGEQYVLPLLAVEKLVVVSSFITVGGKQMIRIDDDPIPVVPLAQVLERSTSPLDPNVQHLAVILAVADQRLAMLVDEAVNEQELAVKPLDAPLKRVRNITGAALLGSGQPAIVLNPADLIRSARGHHITVAPIKPVDLEEVHQPVILVVDDSITTRTLEKNILETAGYQVITATNGLEGLRKIADTPVDVVVSDIEMPEMNGFELARSLRDDPATRSTPIILVTSLERPEDRERGLRAGADAYIVKRGFDQQELLTTIYQLI